MRIKVPVIANIKQRDLKHVYLLSLAREAAKRFHHGSFFRLRELRRIMIEMGYVQPDQILINVRRNPIGFFNHATQSDRVYFVGMPQALKLLAERAADAVSFDDWTANQRNLYIVEHDISDELQRGEFRLVQFKQLYTELIAIRPSGKAQDEGETRQVETINKNGEITKKRVAKTEKLHEFRKQEEKQTIDEYPCGRSYRTIGEELDLTRAAVIRHLSERKTLKIKRKKQLKAIVFRSSETEFKVEVKTWQEFKAEQEEQNGQDDKKRTNEQAEQQRTQQTETTEGYKRDRLGRVIKTMVVVPRSVPEAELFQESRGHRATFFIREQAHTVVLDEDALQMGIVSLENVEYEFGVPFIPNRTREWMKIWTLGMCRKGTVSVMTLKRDIPNVYGSNVQTRIVDGYRLDANPSIPWEAEDLTTASSSGDSGARPLHICASRMALRLSDTQCGPMDKPIIRRMRFHERKWSKGNMLYASRFPTVKRRTHNLVFQSTDFRELAEPNLSPLITKSNSPSANLSRIFN